MSRTVLLAGFDLHDGMEGAVDALLSLPPSLRPIHFGYGERRNKAQLVDDKARFAAFLSKAKSGFCLFGPKGVQYDLTPRGLGHCFCVLKTPPELAVTLTITMARARPLFGYACSEPERLERNFIFAPLPGGSVETFLGRKLDKYVPGLYWLTLLPESLAQEHGIPLDRIAEIALEHRDLGGGQHYFRFYEHPEDWKENIAVPELCRSVPGIFKIEPVRHEISKLTDRLSGQPSVIFENEISNIFNKYR
jgi:hypothetical protein